MAFVPQEWRFGERERYARRDPRQTNEQEPSMSDSTPATPEPTPATPAPAPPAAAAPVAAANPGKTLGIVALILAFFFQLVSLILGFVALSQSKKAGQKNTPALVAVILSIVFIVLGIIGLIVFLAAGATLFGGLAQVCNDLGPGVWEVDGVTYTCG